MGRPRKAHGEDIMRRAANLEQKFKIEGVRRLTEACRAAGYRRHSRILQEDTYFPIRQGRLKIRTINGRTSELIFYVRPDAKGPRRSEYLRVSLKHPPNEVLQVLSLALGIIARVRKERTVYYNENVRINIDRVCGLGSFVELEAELGGKTSTNRSLRLVMDTKAALRLTDASAVAGSYIDLLYRKRGRSKGMPG